MLTRLVLALRAAVVGLMVTGEAVGLAEEDREDIRLPTFMLTNPSNHPSDNTPSVSLHHASRPQGEGCNQCQLCQTK